MPANAEAFHATAAPGAAHKSIDLGESQREFVEALLNASRPVPAGMVARTGEIVERRFNVYRNNVVVGLIETLKDAFPAVRNIVGDECFLAVARAYVTKHLPQTPVMHEYGTSFPDFLAQLEPLKDLPYLADVARLERAWLESYHSSDAPPIERSLLGAIPSSALPEAIFVLHPSIRIVRSRHQVVRIWKANIETEASDTLLLNAKAEDAFVIRPTVAVEVRVLPPGAALFIEALKKGDLLSAAADRAISCTPKFDLAQAIAGLIQCNAIIGWQLNSEQKDHEQSSRSLPVRA